MSMPPLTAGPPQGAQPTSLTVSINRAKASGRTTFGIVGSICVVLMLLPIFALPPIMTFGVGIDLPVWVMVWTWGMALIVTGLAIYVLTIKVRFSRSMKEYPAPLVIDHNGVRVVDGSGVQFVPWSAVAAANRVTRLGHKAFTFLLRAEAHAGQGGVVADPAAWAKVKKRGLSCPQFCQPDHDTIAAAVTHFSAGRVPITGS